MSASAFFLPCLLSSLRGWLTCSRTMLPCRLNVLSHCWRTWLYGTAFSPSFGRVEVTLCLPVIRRWRRLILFHTFFYLRHLCGYVRFYVYRCAVFVLPMGLRCSCVSGGLVFTVQLNYNNSFCVTPVIVAYATCSFSLLPLVSAHPSLLVCCSDLPLFSLFIARLSPFVFVAFSGLCIVTTKHFQLALHIAALSVVRL